MIERFRMELRIALGLEGCADQLLEHRRGQQSPALGQRPIGDAFAGKLCHVLGQGASLGDDMKD